MTYVVGVCTHTVKVREYPKVIRQTTGRNRASKVK